MRLSSPLEGAAGKFLGNPALPPLKKEMEPLKSLYLQELIISIANENYVDPCDSRGHRIK